MFTLITEEGRCGGVIGTQPTHNNWTNVPYNGGLIKEFWNGTDWVESETPEEIVQINGSKLAIEVKYPELQGMNYKLLGLDNLEGIKRDSTLADKGLKGEKRYRKDGVLIWSSEKKYWFQPDGYPDGFRRVTKLFNIDESVAMQWENFYELSPDDKQLFLKQQREFIFEYFKSQQPQLFNFLYTFFAKEINDYIMADGDTLKNTLIEMAETHPYQDDNGVYIVRVTLNQVIPTLTPGVTTTVLQGIIDELV